MQCIKSRRRLNVKYLQLYAPLRPPPFPPPSSPITMAFVAPVPSPLRHSSFLGNERSASSQRLQLLRVSPCMTSEDAPSQPANWFRNFVGQMNARKDRSNGVNKEYATMADGTGFAHFATSKARIVNVAPVCPSGELVQVTVDAEDVGVKYDCPGQFVQLGRLVSGPFRRGGGYKLCFATIANAPGKKLDCLEFLIARGSDPLRLSTLKKGDQVDISPVMGSGLEYKSVVESGGDLHVFVDAPQGFAAVKALIEWDVFRSASGEGAKRSNYITVYYAVPSGRALPYADRFSAWSVYGVNVVPLMGVSVMEYVSSGGLGNRFLGVDFALGCVATEESFEALFCALVLYGLRRSAIYRFTQQVVEDEAVPQDQTRKEGGDKPFGMPEETWQQMKRDEVEREIWEGWVRIREELREEFERKWAAQAKTNREQKRSEEEKRQAWASWCMRNKDRWTKVEWDNTQWRTYWNSWGESRDSWSKNGNWTAGGGGGGGGTTQEPWSQQNSQEYWDWVGKGTGRKSSSGGGRGGRNSRQSYYDTYSGSQAWGNSNNRWSGYQRGGYKYEYQQTEQDKNQYNNSYKYNGNSSSSSGSGWGGWNQGSTRDWWNRGTGGNRRTGYDRNWNTTNSSFGELDFYAVLGINAGASKSEIKKAYRQKAMEHHPDRNPDRSEEAHDKMKQIVVAWSVLKDERKRRQYDQNGSAGL